MTGALESRFPTPERSTGLMLWRVTNAWQREIRAALAPFDFTHVQFVLLAVLASAQHDEHLTQRELADRAATDPMMTSQVLRALEAKGLVDRRPHPSDGRAIALSATPQGVTLANRANAAVEAADRAFFAPLAPGTERFTVDLGRLLAS
ncbi:MarR family transcriptional regulator [Leucobacter sp. CSA2]|uniref:MarR family transcriptional regulator n=1 Tax=Leucobacter edaphi TaxID=2796472 RepID=A0A934QD69_9MICO|nr:MarR family transcriptional regulator [Leucobacter edaphi]MBK0421092.1 MarR family transcriptional regulator [Leucobacter edaphi]